MIKFYYGMSGTFKSTTIDSESKGFENPTIIRSMIKPWKRIEENLFPGLIEKNNIIFATLHLCNLESQVSNLDVDHLTLIERGVTDMLFYQSQECNSIVQNDGWIKKAVEYELGLVENDANSPEKILLIQKDRDFIENKILSEPTRREIFPDVDSYLKAQDDYVKFTGKYNKLTDIIIINDANVYLNSLNYDRQK